MKEVIAKKTSKVLKLEKGQRQLVPFTSKSLNIYGYIALFSVYTVALVTICFTLITNKNNDQRVQIDLNQLKTELITEIQKNIDSSKIITYTKSDSITDQDLLEFKEEMVNKLNHINSKYLEIVAKNKKDYELIIRENTTNSSATNFIDSKNETLTYSKLNAKILRYRQEQKIQRAKEELNQAKARLITSLDLSLKADRDKLRDFQDTMDLKIYSMNRKADEMLYKLKIDKYVVIN